MPTIRDTANVRQTSPAPSDSAVGGAAAPSTSARAGQVVDKLSQAAQSAADFSRTAFVRRPRQAVANQLRAGLNTLSSVHQALANTPKTPSAYLDLLGVAVDGIGTRKSAEEQALAVVTRAQQTKRCLAANEPVKTFFDKQDVQRLTSHLLGINSGPDETAEVHVLFNQYDEGEWNLMVFDRAGYNVFDATVTEPEPGVLWVDYIQGSHGRNAGELQLYNADAKVAGRGNARLVAAGFEALIVEGSKSGVHAIGCYPASQKVAELYAKMGFEHQNGGPPIGEEYMFLDLANLKAVRQALVTFSLGRAMYNDVPKDVQQRLQAQGEELKPPARARWLAENTPDLSTALPTQAAQSQP